MKKLIAMLALAAGTLVLTPSAAQAGPGGRHSSHTTARECDSCGSTVFRVRYIAGYARDGCPVYRWRTVAHRCRPSHGHGHDHGGGHGHDRRDSHRGHDHRR